MTAAVVVAMFLVFLAPAFAESCASGACASGNDAPAVVIDGPASAAVNEARAFPFDPAEEPTPVPVIGIAAGLVLLGVTLTRICIRRRAMVASPVPAVALPADVVVLAAGKSYLAGAPAVSYAPSEPAGRP